MNHRSKAVTIEGPYGCLRPLRQFDSVVLFAGSTGATFTLPLLRDIVQGWRENTSTSAGKGLRSLFGRQTGAVTRHIRFVWVIKSRGQLGWFSEQLSTIANEVHILQEKIRDVKLELTVYVTCDESFTEEHKSLLPRITAPNHNMPARKDAEHGTVQYRRQLIYEERKKTTEKEEVREVARANSEGGQDACGPNETCCCRTAVDETSSPDRIAPCCCASPSKTASSRPTSHISSAPSTSMKQKMLVHPSIAIYSGRPKTRDIIGRSLEQALGESAVVVCGPQGLVADVNQDVCSLSDERAVHKGTGAQGIYLHTESFSY
jgi:hypothetical protein